MRNIKHIVIHCTATAVNTTIESLKKYWREEKKWGNTPGYHYLILRGGTVIQLLDEKLNSNGVHAHNAESINVAYLGGIDKEGKALDNRTNLQKEAMFDLIVRLTEKYPGADVLGHKDIPGGIKKSCPCFDVKEWLKNYVPDFI